MVFEGTIGIGIALLLAPVLAEYAKVRSKSQRGFNWLAVGGVWFIFASSFAISSTLGGLVGSELWSTIGSFFEVLAWLWALIGTLYIGYDIILEGKR